MQFRTELTAERADFSITHQTPIFAVGSCFAENIGERLNHSSIPILTNPYGIVYQVVAIQKIFSDIANHKKYEAKDLDIYNELWFSFTHHSKFSNTNQAACLAEINKNLATAQAHLAKTEFIFITLGTAQVFIHKEKNYFVNNCHKLPATNFTKTRMSVSEVVGSLHATIIDVRSVAPNAKFIFTVSPVRYLREGLIQSQRSKAILLLAIENICQTINGCHYFPAYEYLLDDLRDYRFYDTDMLHPSAEAVDYIYQKFSETYFDADTQRISTQIEKIKRAQAHRPAHTAIAEYARFSTQLQADIDLFNTQNPTIKL